MPRRRAPGLVVRALLAALLACLLAAGCILQLGAQSEPDTTDTARQVEEAIEGLIRWVKRDNGLAADATLLSGRVLEGAGTPALDWFVLGFGRLGIQDDYAAYLAMVKDNVARRYQTEEKLDATKATEWHRVILAMLAAGGDPTAIPGADGPIDLVADGIYNRGRTKALDAQGLNGWIWGLLALDASGVEVPADAFTTRQEMIDAIVSAQHGDGGFALGGGESDTDMTAMALTALAPYQSQTPVAGAVEKGLGYLSARQGQDGGFASYGLGNVESCAQVLVALCALNIDPLNDARFIKNMNTPLDGLLQYRLADGGFTHSFEDDAENPLFEPGASGGMAGEQALYALAAFYRFSAGLNPLYDFSPEEKGAQSAFSAGGMALDVRVNEADVAAWKAMASPPATGSYADVIKLIDKIKSTGAEAEYPEMLADLELKQQQILETQAEIESLNAAVLERLYPLENIGLGDRQAVAEILARADALGEEDRQLVLGYEDILRAQAKIEGTQRALIIGGVLAVAVAAAVVLVALRMKKRRAAKRAAMMPAEDEDE